MDSTLLPVKMWFDTVQMTTNLPGPAKGRSIQTGGWDHTTYNQLPPTIHEI